MRDFRGPRGREESPMKRSNRKRHRPNAAVARLKRAHPRVSRDNAHLDSSPETSVFRGLRAVQISPEAPRWLVSSCISASEREPDTFRCARTRDARRDNPRARPRGSARHSATPPRWPTPRDLRARNPLSQNAVRTPQNANAPAGRPGRSLLTCWRASFARAS